MKVGNNCSNASTPQIISIDSDPSLIVINALICVVILVVNTLILITLHKYKGLQTKSNAFIVSLAVADLLVGFNLIGRQILFVPGGEWTFEHHRYTCMLLMTSFFVCGIESTSCLVFIAVDRYLFIAYPFWHQNNSTKNTVISSIVLSWIFSVCSGLYPLWYNDFRADQHCVSDHEFDTPYIIFLGVYFVISGLVIVIVYCRIFKIGAFHREKSRASFSYHGNTLESSVMKKRSFLRFLVLASAMFYVCWIPLIVTYTIRRFVGGPNMVVRVAVDIASMNSGCNFFSFLTASPEFRFCLKRWLFGRWQLDNDAASSPNASIRRSSTVSARVSYDGQGYSMQYF